MQHYQKDTFTLFIYFQKLSMHIRHIVINRTDTNPGRQEKKYRQIWCAGIVQGKERKKREKHTVEHTVL